VRRSVYHAAVIILLTLTLAGCSVEKNTGSSRFYHSLISKYNIWFNGNEAYRAGLEKITAGEDKNFTP